MATAAEGSGAQTLYSRSEDFFNRYIAALFYESNPRWTYNDSITGYIQNSKISQAAKGVLLRCYERDCAQIDGLKAVSIIVPVGLCIMAAYTSDPFLAYSGIVIGPAVYGIALIRKAHCERSTMKFAIANDRILRDQQGN